MRPGATLAYLARRTLPALPLPRSGDGHSVLVLPGFTAGDLTTFNLRLTVQAVGCRPHGWRLGRNHGPTTSLIDGMERRLLDLSEASGQPVSIVGWSLGGVYARRLARRQPARVRSVITLGSPTRFPDQPESLVQRLWEARRALFDAEVLADISRPETVLAPLTVPTTVMWSRIDRIVPPDAVRLPAGRRIEHVEVLAGHFGLGTNPAALYVVADRLTQPLGHWRRFRPPLAMAPWYPTHD